MGSILGFQWPLELFTVGLSRNAAYTTDSIERNNQEFWGDRKSTTYGYGSADFYSFAYNFCTFFYQNFLLYQ